MHFPVDTRQIEIEGVRSDGQSWMRFLRVALETAALSAIMQITTVFAMCLSQFTCIGDLLAHILVVICVLLKFDGDEMRKTNFLVLCITPGMFAMPVPKQHVMLGAGCFDIFEMDELQPRLKPANRIHGSCPQAAI